MQSYIPIGRLAVLLDSLNEKQAWAAVLAATLAVTIADYALPGIGFAPLFIPITCAACWCLGTRAGYAIATGAAALAVAPYMAVSDHGHPLLLAAQIAVRLATFCFVAATIAGFRRLFDRARFLASRDRMTGALNHETFRERARETLDAALSTRQTLLLMILDLDDFKTLNDRHGHAAGDEVLRAFAREACDIIRREDDFGRIGGDEFALLVPVHSAQEGEVFAATLHKRLSAVLAGTPHPVTCSMGALVIAPDAPRDEAEVLHLVDGLMYAVKRAGKNAVRIGHATVETVATARDYSRPLRVGAV
ncbi:GGDEF domain-containing protein [Rhizorhapis sp. SPR117]|uniref:GGDEF domain-containing protein n=1 Tax=Rhizorhapis sp. SPR117 TaxID=2912611 RepID=UPI001F2BA4E8|nr:GGDEF domain-containing protein [Rhizorhapis sp. SPR117]